MTEAAEESVAGAEILARYIVYRRHIRQNNSVRPDAFVPHPWPDLSVTRHLALSEIQIWKIGDQVAAQVKKPLRGRADVRAEVFVRASLSVTPAPVHDNVNHANVTGWPADKPAQKILAQEISAAADCYRK